MSPAPATDRTLWVGTYPADGVPGTGEGIWRVRLDTVAGAVTGAELVRESPSPSFLALRPDGGTLYAVGETAPGMLRAFEVLDAAPWLAPRGEAVPSGGDHPCHVVATADAVWVANYGDGTFSSRALDADGGLGAATDAPHAGSGPDLDRQAGSHAHFVAGLDARPVVVDLGTDEIRDHRDLGRAVALATLPPGTGPRHLVDLGGGALAVVGELDPAVFVLVPGPEGMAVAARYDACGARPVSGTDGRNYPSHLALSLDGDRLYVAVRGADVISVFAVDRSGAVPALRSLGEFGCGGVWPRHFAVLGRGGSGGGDLLVVANQESGVLSAFAVDVGGTATATGEYPLPAPACVLVG